MKRRQGLSRAIAVHSAAKRYADMSMSMLSKVINIPKCTLYRYNAKRKQRIAAIGYDFFETAAGLVFLSRLIICINLIFGIKAGVGAETIRLFFESMLLSRYAACSTSKLREIKRKIRAVIETYGEAELAEVLKRCRTKALSIGVDETQFDDETILLMMELQSGFIFAEVITDDRKKGYQLKVRNPG